MGDIEVNQGQAAVEEFQKKYGEESIFFVKVDVTKPQNIKGKHPYNNNNNRSISDLYV